MLWPANMRRSGAGVPWSKRILIPRPAMSMARSRDHQAAFGVPQHQLHLFARHAREPLQELSDPRAIFEILEQRPDRYASSFEQPLAADLSRHALHRRTLVPIEHGGVLSDVGRGG